MNINQVTVAGNITKPIELKKLASGMSVAQITLATNRSWKDKDGSKKEDVQFVDFVAFGKTAETLAQYCLKGQNMLFQGRLSTRSWEKPDKTKGYKTEVILESFQFGQKPQGATTEVPQAKQSKAIDDFDNQDSGKGFEYPTEEINPDDIPF